MDDRMKKLWKKVKKAGKTAGILFLTLVFAAGCSQTGKMVEGTTETSVAENALETAAAENDAEDAAAGDGESAGEENVTAGDGELAETGNAAVSAEESAETENAASGDEHLTDGKNSADDDEQTADAKKATAAADSYIDTAHAVQIILSVDDTTISGGSGARVSGNVVTISAGGTYQITGSLTDGQIYVDVDGDDTVVLLLAGAEISNTEEAAVYVENAGLTVLYLAEGTENRIVSGEDTGSLASEGKADDAAEGGAVWAKDDLLIGGSGSLEVSGFINNGIQTSNNLTVESGTITVDAVNNGIKGKDSMTISGGTIAVTSGGDGIKSDDTTGNGYGVIEISGGEIQIESGCDGIQAETELTISGGEIQIESGGDGIQAETVLTISDGKIQITAGGGSGDTAVASSEGWGFNGFYEGWDMEDEDTESTKGIKAGDGLFVSGGTISVDAYDDALHSNGTITVSGGSITVSTGDDGVHADTELAVTDGSITVTQSVEGLEANQITISGGDISVTASDDGINANGGSSSWGWGMGQTMSQNTSGESQSTSEEMPLLLITGGTLWINAQGDGLDSNGDLTIEGGTVVVDGPSDSMNGAIDSGTENGGVCTISGGTVLAIGSSGMAETFSGSSEQYSFMLTLAASYAAGSTITINDAGGNVLFEHTSERTFSSVIFSSPELEEDGTYQITIDGDTTEITLTSVAGSYSWSGSSSGNYGGGFSSNQNSSQMRGGRGGV